MINNSNFFDSELDRDLGGLFVRIMNREKWIRLC